MNFHMDLENKLEENPKHCVNFAKTYVNNLDTHQKKLRSYVVEINSMLIRIFMKPLLRNLNLKTKLIELNFKIIMLNISTNKIW